MNKLTGDKNVNFMILMQLNDRELSMVCQVNRYVNEICKDETFWFNRVLITYKYLPEIARDMKTYLEFDNWKEFYFWLKDEEMSRGRVNIIAKSINKKEVIDKIVELFKKMKLSKWINREEFIKVLRRHAFVNAQDELNEEYQYEEDEDEIDKIQWKTFKSIGELELMKIFVDEWNRVKIFYI